MLGKIGLDIYDPVLSRYEEELASLTQGYSSRLDTRKNTGVSSNEEELNIHIDQGDIDNTEDFEDNRPRRPLRHNYIASSLKYIV